MTTTTRTTTRWIARRPNQPTQPAARVRLFCFPYAGAGASAFRRWSDELPRWIDVCPVQLPGREERWRESPHTDLDQLLRLLVGELRPYLNAPFALFGHSLGALVAFELARELSRRGLPRPVHVFVSGRVAPHVIDSSPVLYSLPEDKLIRQLKTLDGTPAAVLDNVELMRMFLPLLRADLQLNETYRHVPEPLLDVPLTALGGREDVRVPLSDVHSWRHHTRAEFRFRELPGGHFFVNTALARVMDEIATTLSAVPIR